MSIYNPPAAAESSGGDGVGVPLDSPVVTVTDQTGTLTNSRRIVAGTNITLSTAVAGQLSIAASGGGSGVAAGDSPTWSATHRFQGQVNKDAATGQVSIGIDGASVPAVVWVRPAMNINENIWHAYVNARTWTLRATDNTGSAGKIGIAVVRFQNMTAGITEIQLGNTTDKPAVIAYGFIRKQVADYATLTSVGAVQGDCAICTNSNTAVYNATVAGGGANIVPVFYNGTVWKVG